MADLLGITVGHYRIKDPPPTDVEDGLRLDVLKKPISENSSISAVDLTLLPVVQSLENCVPAADYGGGVHSAMFRGANGIVDPSEGVTPDPPSLVFSPTDHFIRLHDANINSLLCSSTDAATLLIQVNSASGECQLPLFNAKDDDRRGAVDAAHNNMKTS